MNETPRMDAAKSEGEMYKIGCQLERELAEARRAIATSQDCRTYFALKDVAKERDSLRQQLEEAKAAIEFNKDYEAVYLNLNSDARDAIEKLGLSKVPHAGSLKSDEADGFVAIATKHVIQLRQQNEKLRSLVSELDSLLQAYLNHDSEIFSRVSETLSQPT